MAAETNNGQYPGLSAYVTEYGLQAQTSAVYYDLTSSGLVYVDTPTSNYYRYTSYNFNEKCKSASVYIEFPNAVFYGGSTYAYCLEMSFTMRVNNSMPVDWYDYCAIFDGDGRRLDNAQLWGSMYQGSDGYYFKYNVYIDTTDMYMLDLSKGIRFHCITPQPWSGSATSSANYFEFSPMTYDVCTVIADADPSEGILVGIDSIGNLLEHGNENLNNNITSVDGVNTQFQNSASQYESYEQQYTDSMSNNLSAISNDVSGFTFTNHFITASSWLTDKLLLFFNGMGDFKMFIIVPCILGLALFFIGRGSGMLSPSEDASMEKRYNSEVAYKNYVRSRRK